MLNFEVLFPNTEYRKDPALVFWYVHPLKPTPLTGDKSIANTETINIVAKCAIMAFIMERKWLSSELFQYPGRGTMITSQTVIEKNGEHQGL